MDADDNITPFRMSKPFEEHMSDVLEAMASDPSGLYQVTYRVGPIMVSAQIWRDPALGKPVEEQLSQFDREFLKQICVVVDDSSGEHAVS